MRGLSMWFTGVETMPELKEVVNRVLLPLQLSLGIFQIMKSTPLWAVIHCTLAYLLHCFYFPYTDYKQLEGFQGRVFKRVISHATTAGDVSKIKNPKDPKDSNNPDEMTVKSEKSETVSVVYLGQKFVLERMEGDKMVVNFESGEGKKKLMKDRPAYCITDKMWKTVKYIEKVASKTVFVRDHTEIWEEVVTADIMKFEEVLDSVILDNRAVIRLDHDYFLPVNLLMSEDKLLKTLNFVGLFLKTQKHIHWLIPALLTFTSAVMGFSTMVRLFIDGFINKISCSAVQLLFDLLPLATRRPAYCWGNWVENLKPSNDLQSKIVSGDICVLVAAGAKADSGSLADRCKLGDLLGAKPYLEPFVDFESLASHLVNKIKGHPLLFKCCLKYNSKCDSVYIEWIFDNTNQICSLKAGRIASQELLQARDIYIIADEDDFSWEKDIKLFTFASCCGKGQEHNKSLIGCNFDTTSVDVECSTEEEAIKLLIFASYMAKYKSGSLKSYDRNTNAVYIRRFVESINAYVRSGYPPLYKLRLVDVVVL